jgi:hypothetical protein
MGAIETCWRTVFPDLNKCFVSREHKQREYSESTPQSYHATLVVIGPDQIEIHLFITSDESWILVKPSEMGMQIAGS